MGGGGGFMKAPAPPPPPPAPPAPVVAAPVMPDTTTNNEDIENARQKQLRQAALAQGRQSTILTGGLGATGTAPTQSKQLLGA